VLCTLTRRRVLWLFDPTWPYSGLFEGRRALELIRPYVGERIEDLPRPYAAVATDLGSGDEVVLREGAVVEALRASIAIPGIFTPQRWQGRLLVDGGLVNPLPVDVARQLGAQFVIAVSVLGFLDESAPHAPERQGVTIQLLARFLARHKPQQRERVEPPGADSEGDLGLIDVLSRATTLIQARIAMARLREDPPDALVAVPMPEIGLLDYDRAAEAIAAGRAAARRALPEIKNALATAAPLSHKVTRWLDDASERFRQGWLPGERR
jgi:NTE family protein